MERYEGVPSSPGSAAGTVVSGKSRKRGPSRDESPNPGLEPERYEKAKKRAGRDLERLYDAAMMETDEETAATFQMHQMMIEDPDFQNAAEEAMSHGFTAEYAVSYASEKVCSIFESMDDEYMRGRASDVREVASRLLRKLSGEGDGNAPAKGDVILIADDLAPSEIINVDLSRIRGLVTRKGSDNGHAMILARTMGIPAVAGIQFSGDPEGRTAILYGDSGSVIIDPDDEAMREYLEAVGADDAAGLTPGRLIGMEAVTSFGAKIGVYANAGSMTDVEAAAINGSEGIGLFGSEFMHFERKSPPSEEELYGSYRSVLEKMGERPVIIRTADMGCCERRLLGGADPLRTQLRAVFRAAMHGNAMVAYPMINSVEELEEARTIAGEAMGELAAEGVPCPEIPQGIIIETPAAAVTSDLLAKRADFLTIDADSLARYALAADRDGGASKHCRHDHEAVLRLIRTTILNARKAGARVGIYGDAAEDLSLTERLVEYGIEFMSVSPACILPLKRKIISM